MLVTLELEVLHNAGGRAGVGLGRLLLVPVVEVFVMRLVKSTIQLTTEVSVAEKISPKTWPAWESPGRKQSEDWPG